MTGGSVVVCCCLWLMVASLMGPSVVRAFLQPSAAPPAPAAAGPRAWLPPQAAALAGTGRRRPWRSPFLQASPALAAEPATAAAAAGEASGSGEKGEAPAGSLQGEDKAALFVALEGHVRRKEAFEILWNSEMEFTEAEYQELLKACFRLGYGA